MVVGRVVGAHGLRGQVRVRCWTDPPEALRDAARVALCHREEEPEGRWYEVAGAGPGRRGELRLRLRGVDAREAAEALRGLFVAVSADALAPPGPGEYYGYQLVGCRVSDQDGRALGVVSGIWPTGGPDLLVIDDGAGGERLVPAAEDLLLEVDVPGRRIVIDAPPGLLD